MKERKIKSFDEFKDKKPKFFEKTVEDRREYFRNFISKFNHEIQKRSKVKEVLLKYGQNSNIKKEDLIFLKTQILEIVNAMGVGLPSAIVAFKFLIVAFIMFLYKYFKVDIKKDS